MSSIYVESFRFYSHFKYLQLIQQSDARSVILKAQPFIKDNDFYVSDNMTITFFQHSSRSIRKKKIGKNWLTGSYYRDTRILAVPVSELHFSDKYIKFPSMEDYAPFWFPYADSYFKFPIPYLFEKCGFPSFQKEEEHTVRY